MNLDADPHDARPQEEQSAMMRSQEEQTTMIKWTLRLTQTKKMDLQTKKTQ